MGAKKATTEDSFMLEQSMDASEIGDKYGEAQ